MKKELSKLHLGDFRKLYEFFDERLSGSYGVDTAYEEGGDMHEFAGAMCIRIYKDSYKAMIKIFDPAYKKPSEDGKVVIKITIHEDDHEPKIKEIRLARMEEESFFDLIKRIINFTLLYPSDNDDEIDEMEKGMSNEKSIKFFESWVKEL